MLLKSECVSVTCAPAAHLYGSVEGFTCPRARKTFHTLTKMALKRAEYGEKQFLRGPDS